MVEFGERFLYASEVAGSLLIGCIFIYMAFVAAVEDRWKMMIAAVLCFSLSLFFCLMYINSKKEREKKMSYMKD